MFAIKWFKVHYDGSGGGSSNAGSGQNAAVLLLVARPHPDLKHAHRFYLRLAVNVFPDLVRAPWPDTMTRQVNVRKDVMFFAFGHDRTFTSQSFELVLRYSVRTAKLLPKIKYYTQESDGLWETYD